ncbi:hypothetical protein ACFTAO_43605 [Paenibacillus rhizoplanae]
MDASLRKLFDHVAELDQDHKLVKELNGNEFLNNTVNPLNCGSRNYVFLIFKDDFTINVTITKKNSKADFTSMSAILDICDSIDEGFNFIAAKLSDKNYDEAAIVMQDIIDAYTTISLEIDKLCEFIDMQNVNLVIKQFKYILLEVVVHFNDNRWDELEEELSQQIIPNFLLWKKNELSNTFSPYITR